MLFRDNLENRPGKGRCRRGNLENNPERGGEGWITRRTSLVREVG
jgi:hypothetical protein